MQTIYSSLIFVLWTVVRLIATYLQVDISSFQTPDKIKMLFFPWAIIGLLTIILAFILKIKGENNSVTRYFRVMLIIDTAFLITFILFLLFIQPLYYVFILLGTVLFSLIQGVFMYQSFKYHTL